MRRLLLSLALSAALGPLPGGWPGALQLGLKDFDQPPPAQLRGAVSLRYQYLVGGVNTGNGWSTWNPDGTFASMYVSASRAAGLTPVFTYYQVLHSSKSGGGEDAQDLATLKDPAIMKAYYGDFALLMQKAAGADPVIVHVEPDLWGYVQRAAAADDAATVPAAVASSGYGGVTAGLPNTAAGFAQALVRLRDQLAPNVRLAFHLSSWGTGTDIAINDPSDAQVDTMGDRLAAFYRSLGATFDLTFSDQADRDAGFTGHPWDAADYERGARLLGRYAEATGQRIALWQLPLGNAKLDAAHRDNHVEWFLDDPSRAHLQRYADAGVIALLFGEGADGQTTATTDGGLFLDRARAYTAAPLALPAGDGTTTPPPSGGTPPPAGGGAGGGTPPGGSPSTGGSTTASRLSLRATPGLRVALRRGLLVRVTGVHGTVVVRASVSRMTARRAHLRGRSLVVARGRGTARGGRAAVRVRFDRADARRLAQLHRVPLTLRLVAGGDPTRRALTLRRR